MINNHKLEKIVINNFSNTKLKLLFPPIILLIFIVFIFLSKGEFSVQKYIEIQKDLFYYLNDILSQLPSLQFNLTQIGNPLIFLALLTVFIVYAPKLWEGILTSIIISAAMSFIFKIIFDVPRPAEVFDNDSFVIIGETLKGYKSLPSGHSITTFTLITVLLLGFMPKEFKFKISWSISILLFGFIIAFSRVGVGAHYPLDVVIGGIIGFMSTIIGVNLNNQFNLWKWIKRKKYYPILMFFLIIGGFAIVSEISHNNLLIFYFSLATLLITLYLIIKIHGRKEN